MSENSDRLSSLSSMESFSEETSSFVEITDGTKTPPTIYCYEVLFKCVTGQFLSEEILQEGDFVTVEGDRGYNVGVIHRLIPNFTPQSPTTSPTATTTPPLKILTKLTDNVDTIKSMLASKIVAENAALLRCREFCSGRRIGLYIETLSAEFQFDRKKLTIYVKKSGEVSVCKLVRTLYDAFKMRISVEEVNSIESIKELIQHYLKISQIGVPFSDVFTYQPITNTYCPSQPNIIDKLPTKLEDGSTTAGSHHNSNLSTTKRSTPKLLLQKPSLLTALHDYMPHQTTHHNNGMMTGMNENMYRYQTHSYPQQQQQAQAYNHMMNTTTPLYNGMHTTRTSQIQQTSAATQQQQPRQYQQPMYRSENYLGPESNLYTSHYGYDHHHLLQHSQPQSSTRYPRSQQLPTQQQQQSSTYRGQRSTSTTNGYASNDSIYYPSSAVSAAHLHPHHHLTSELDYSVDDYHNVHNNNNQHHHHMYREDNYHSYQTFNQNVHNTHNNGNDYETDYYTSTPTILPSSQVFTDDSLEMNINSLSLTDSYDVKYRQPTLASNINSATIKLNNNNNMHTHTHNNNRQQPTQTQQLQSLGQFKGMSERESAMTATATTSTAANVQTIVGQGSSPTSSTSLFTSQQPIGSLTLPSSSLSLSGHSTSVSSSSSTSSISSNSSSASSPYYVVHYAPDGTSTLTKSTSSSSSSPPTSFHADNNFQQSTLLTDQLHRNNNHSPTGYTNWNQTVSTSSPSTHQNLSYSDYHPVLTASSNYF